MNTIARNALIGAAAGAAGALAMEIFQIGLAKVSPAGHQWLTKSGDTTHHPQVPERIENEKGSYQQRSSTVKAADRVGSAVIGRSPSLGWQAFGAQILHYATGAGPGAVYGVVADSLPGSRIAKSLALGMSVWVLLNETLIPRLGLAPPPRKIPLQNHLFSAITHAVYGLTTEAVRRVIK